MVAEPRLSHHGACRGQARRMIFFVWVRSLKDADLRSRSGQSHSSHKAAWGMSCCISFDVAVLSESIDGSTNSLDQFDREVSAKSSDCSKQPYLRHV